MSIQHRSTGVAEEGGTSFHPATASLRRFRVLLVEPMMRLTNSCGLRWLQRVTYGAADGDVPFFSLDLDIAAEDDC